jgi:dethiobiotin synthetase
MDLQLEPLSAQRLEQAKWAYTTRRINRNQPMQLLCGDLCPQAGDLLLARVEKLGHHRRLELVSSRRASLFQGDEIVVAYGNRYAPNQFEGIVPEHLGACRLIAAGGVAARLLNCHDRVKSATRITPLGLLADQDSHRINLSRSRLPKAELVEGTPLVLVVAGTSMNSGKTTTCANLVRGLVRQKIKVAAAKFTGTGAGADYRALVDAGASPVFDFIDAGYVSTYRANREVLLDIVMTLGAEMSASRPDVIIIEVADGLLQRETALLFSTPAFTDWVDGVIFAANDALGALAGVSWLNARQLPVFAITGVLTSSPLAQREAEDICGLPVYHTEALARPSVSSYVYNCLKFRRQNLRAAANEKPG